MMSFYVLFFALFLTIVNSRIIWLYWHQGLTHALQDPFRAACYDSIVRAAEAANMPVIVGDEHWHNWLVDEQDIPFKVLRGLAAHAQSDMKKNSRSLAVLADLWRLTIIHKYGGIYLDFSTYIADPNYFKEIWDKLIANKWVFYGFKAFRAGAEEGHNSRLKKPKLNSFEYQVWTLVAEALSPFLAIWKDLSIAKISVGWKYSKKGFEGLEQEKKPPLHEKDRFRSDYLSMGHHSAQMIDELIASYPWFKQKVRFDYVSCSYEYRKPNIVAPEVIKSDEWQLLYGLSKVKVEVIVDKVKNEKKQTSLHVCLMSGKEPKFFKFFGGGAAWTSQWTKQRLNPGKQIKDTFIQYLRYLNKMDTINRDPKRNPGRITTFYGWLQKHHKTHEVNTKVTVNPMKYQVARVAHRR